MRLEQQSPCNLLFRVFAGHTVDDQRQDQRRHGGEGLNDIGDELKPNHVDFSFRGEVYKIQ
jgi:hypothetical protein